MLGLLYYQCIHRCKNRFIINGPVCLLISVKQAEFTYIKEKTNATAGNLSVQIQKLKEAGYIDVIKEFKENYPNTTCKITKKGISAFEEYVKALQQYLHAGQP